jgi:hypothetical protein
VGAGVGAAPASSLRSGLCAELLAGPLALPHDVRQFVVTGCCVCTWCWCASCACWVAACVCCKNFSLSRRAASTRLTSPSSSRPPRCGGPRSCVMVTVRPAPNAGA